MKKTINLQGREIEYTLSLSARAKNIRITIHGDGTCTVTKPINNPSFLLRFSGANGSDEQEFMKRKTGWILETLEKVKVRAEKQKKQEEKWQKLGLNFEIKYDRVGAGSSSDYKAHKKKALEISLQKIKRFNEIYNFRFSAVSIKNQKTRWGSCSAKGRLNFSYKIAFLPSELADYLAVHELCHLGEMNHSKKFWDLVAKTIPDYKLKRSILKRINLQKI